MELLELPDRCPICDYPYEDGSTYCANCETELTQTERNYCLDPKCSKHRTYLPVGLAECPVCHKPTSNADKFNKMI